MALEMTSDKTLEKDLTIKLSGSLPHQITYVKTNMITPVQYR